jgi:hypothetical protein
LLDGPSPHTYCGNGFLETCLVGSNIIGQYTCILTNNAQELSPYSLGFKRYTNRIRTYFLSEPRFEPGSLGWMTDSLANSAVLPLEVILKVCQMENNVMSRFDKWSDEQGLSWTGWGSIPSHKILIKGKMSIYSFWRNEAHRLIS